MSERNGVQDDRSNDYGSVERATRKPRQTRVYLPFPPGFDGMSEADQRKVCWAMAEEIQLLLGVGPQWATAGR